MTAEEYLETRRCNSAISKKCDMCYMDAAYEAIEMARMEEREKAIEMFKAVSMIIMSPFVSDGELDKAANGLVDIVTELLKQ